MFNYAISGAEFCGFDVLDLIAVLTALKVAAATLMVIVTENVLCSYAFLCSKISVRKHQK